MIDTRQIPDPWRRFDATIRDFPSVPPSAVLSLLPVLRDDGTRPAGIALVIATMSAGAHLLMSAWAIGARLRAARAAEAERLRQAEQAARTAERARIARELHDVVTHQVTAMVVQAEAARYLTAAPDRLDAALSTVGDTGRRAIADLRAMLDLLPPVDEAEHRADVD